MISHADTHKYYQTDASAARNLKLIDVFFDPSKDLRSEIDCKGGW
jgi:hypothetical protein